MNTRRIYLIIVSLLCVISLQAQVRYGGLTNRQRQQLCERSLATIRQYEERLQRYRDSLYSDSVAAPQLIPKEEIAQLFLPFTFYTDVVHDAFTIGNRLSPLDQQFLTVYLSHPELVVRTQTQLEKTGTVIKPTTVTEQLPTNLEAPAPEEPTALPIDMIVLKPNFWDFAGDGYLQFMQNYVSGNWYQGGESNYSLMGGLTLQANYNNKKKLKWENKLEVKIGLQTTNGDTIHNVKTSEDLLRYTSKLGLQASKKWYYTLQGVASTQIVRMYDQNQRPVISDFMSPFEFNLSLGMDYNVDWINHKLKGSVHLAPIAYNLKYVDRLSLAERNGIDAGHHSKNDIGSQMTVDLKWVFSDNIQWQTRLFAYTTYKRTQIEWENTLNFQFNRWISCKFYIYPRFDDSVVRDDRHGYFQYKEYTSLGFAYSF